ncbi:MAG: SLC13 family permease [Gemmatimonadetes bacterium]|nr:SLC13 family permease [Gemmatimonadota bacterium]
MTPSIALVFGILAVALLLFASGAMRMDVVSLLVLGALALTGLVTTEQALAGFSSPAVVTVWAMFILSAGLTRTGIANRLGRPIRRMSQGGELQLMVALMVASGLLSALINTVTVAAIMLPVTMDIARRTRRPPSRLLLPMSLGCLLGGPFTAISTAPNILVTEALRDAGLEPFSLLAFTPITAAILTAGVLFMVLGGRRLLPDRDVSGEARGSALSSSYALQEHLFTARVKPDSPLVGRTLAESRLGSALHLTVLGIRRRDRVERAPTPDEKLQAGDVLILHGLPDHLHALHGREHLIIEPFDSTMQELAGRLVVAEARVGAGSPLEGLTLAEGRLRREHGVHVRAVQRQDGTRHHELRRLRLQAGDTLLLQGERERLLALEESGRVEGLQFVLWQQAAAGYGIESELVPVRVPAGSVLAGRTLAESRLGNAFGLTAIGAVRGVTLMVMPHPDETVEADDIWLLHGSRADLDVMAGLQNLEILAQTPAQVEELESLHMTITEVVLSPRTTLSGRTLGHLHFRDRYGLTVLAVWREGKPFRTELRDVELRFGDALLVYGPRGRIQAVAADPDFVVLDESAARAPRPEKEPVAAAIMAAVLLAAMLGWVPITIAAVLGSVAMVLGRCISMDEAYRAIDWQAVFVIAGMLPLGVALDQSGAAALVAQNVLGSLGDLGPRAMMAGLFFLTVIAAQMIPAPAVVVLISPVALSAAASTGISPYTLMMTVALAASASYASPVHPAQLLVMGPGGYRFTDYVRIGGPMTLVAFVVIMTLVPLMWPP